MAAKARKKQNCSIYERKKVAATKQVKLAASAEGGEITNKWGLISISKNFERLDAQLS